jgi:hypothetical protein
LTLHYDRPPAIELDDLQARGSTARRLLSPGRKRACRIARRVLLRLVLSGRVEERRGRARNAPEAIASVGSADTPSVLTH